MAESEAPHVRGFLFADLRGYTQFVEAHGDKAASELLSVYRSLVRAAVAQFNGAEIRTEGDGFYVVFPSPSSAIRCGLAILEAAASSTAAAGGPLPVGIGIHAGETADSAEGFVGSAVNIAARVCGLAAPGELLITETVHALVRTSLPLSVESGGRRHLKGIRQPIALLTVRPSGAGSLPRSRRIRSVAARRLERRPLVAAFAALVGVAIVATVVLAIGLLTNTNAHPGAGRLGAGAAGSGSLKPTPSASDPGTFPNAAERALLARLNSTVGSFCRRAATSEYPPLAQGGTGFPSVRVCGARWVGHAPISCFCSRWTRDSERRPSATSKKRPSVASSSSRWPLHRSATVPQIPKAHMNWSFGPLTGKLLCIATPARARIIWNLRRART